MPLNWPISGIFPGSPQQLRSQGYIFILVSASAVEAQISRVSQYLSFCRVLLHNLTISPFLDPEGKRANGPFLVTYRMQA
jgi:hypothetical protein